MSFIAAVLLLNMDDIDTFVCFANLLNKPCEVAFFRLDENLVWFCTDVTLPRKGSTELNCVYFTSAAITVLLNIAK